MRPAAPPSPDRRTFVRDLALGGFTLGTLGLSGCGGGSGDDAAQAVPSPTVAYAHGVASGDPLSDRVILWTRLTTAETAAVTVAWEVSATLAFTTLAASGTTTTDATRDWTVKIDATGLQPATRYWYRFKVGTQVSPVGRARTLPVGAVGQVRLAVFSCAHFAAGYFNVYAAAAQREDLDAVLHLGDYLYEYGRDGYANEQATALGRLVLPATELLTLANYRQRYAQVRADADLQALHAAVPMIAVWDDHEVANDTWRGGAQNHTATTEGAFTARRAAAVQAWHEWLPVRTGADRLSIYRSFAFGDLLALHMLDTRVLARDQQLDYANFLTATGLNAAAFTSRRRSCWTRWCRARASASRATRRSSRKPPAECRADWVYVSTVASRTYTVVSDKALRVLPGVGNRKVVV